MVLLGLLLAAAPVTETWALATAGGRVGTLRVSTAGRSVAVDWVVEDDGRALHLTEAITLDPRGRVQRRELQGRDALGAPVRSSFWVEGSRVRWQTLDDRGEAPAAGAPLYLDPHGTPWFLGHALQALLQSRSGTRPLLPQGTLRLQRLGEVTVGGQRLAAHALWGLGLEPTVLLARGDRLAAALGPGPVLVEERLLPERRAVEALGPRLLARALEPGRLVHRLPGPLWLTNVRRFDPLTGTVDALPSSVLVAGGRIEAVQPGPPPAGARAVDGEGGTLLPGLVDGHARLDPAAALLHLAAGVTQVRAAQDDPELLVALAKELEAGRLPGPRVWKLGRVDGPSPFAAHPALVVSAEEPGVAALAWYPGQGFAGLQLLSSLRPELLRPLAAEAHRLGLKVTGRVPAFMTAERALRDGQDEVGPLSQLVLGLLLTPQEDGRGALRFTAPGERAGTLDLKGQPFRTLVAVLKGRQAAVEPTLAALGRQLLARPGRASPTDAGWLSHAPPPLQRARASALLEVRAEADPAHQRSFARLQAVLAALEQEGVPLVPASDDLPGLGLQAELEAWGAAGVPPGRVLALATLGAARWLGQEAEAGTVAPGKRAELLVVEGDPTADLAALRRVRLVVAGELAVFPDEVHQALGLAPFAAHLALPAK